MTEIISKELLSVVLNCSVKSVGDNVTEFTMEYLTESYGFGDGCLCEINIYELAYKCKEWSLQHSLTGENVVKHNSELTHGFNSIRLLSGPTSIADCVSFECSVDNLTRGTYKSSQIFYAETEPEAIFKATQWILDNKEK